MKTLSADRRHVTAYPTNRVVGTITDASQAGEAGAALLAAGFGRDAINVLHGDEDLRRLELTDEQHGLFEQVQRTVIRTFELEEFRHLTHHIEDLRAGRFVIMVLAKRREQRMLAGDILHRYGAEFVGFYGRWAWEDLPPDVRTTPEEFAGLFARAWNARDADALASLFDADAEFVNETGVCLQDRESIRTAHASRLQNLAGRSTLSAADPKVKQLSPEVAVVRVLMTLFDDVPDNPAATPTSRSSIVSFVVHRAGDRWLCASAQNTALMTE